MIQKAFKFDFREAHNRDNYIVGETNSDAIKWIDIYPNWKNNGLVIEGPRASGKSHLVRVWQKKSNCSIFDSEQVNEERINAKDNKNIAIENLENINNFEFFLHLINYKKEKKLNFLLTSSISISSLNISLKDIKSRLLELPKVKISLPTDNIIKGLIFKLMKDKGVLIDNKLIDFMINRIERSYEGINDFIQELNKVSLEKKKNISKLMIKEVLDRYKLNENE
ncbi:MAG: hypothetical protein CFH34_00672 [Alphaproteobacteria bacterium MarineAlpha9_Bin4]|nr:hypothetical protein [Pelagibacterales bacterium]PPR26855.1 MAG: hypothetical protein CFH34_00672 [Alphaproteobacteria bacterium MarineAlpha9_Bin4]|tara:strand:- start:523 stop:1194 length:672 start_codon:yes stop_codon:yes gene_type:complete